MIIHHINFFCLNLNGKVLQEINNEEDILRIVSCLLDNGADPNIPNKNEVSNLTEAVLLKSTKVIECLLRAGANPNSIPEKTEHLSNEYLISPIHACFAGKGTYIRDFVQS